MSVSTSPGSPVLRTMTPFQTASPLGRAGVRQQLVRHPLLSTMASGPAGPLGHLPYELRLLREPLPYELRLRREPHGRSRPLLRLPTCRFARCHFRPTMTMQSLWELLPYGLRLLLVTRRLRLQGRMPSTTLQSSTTLLNCGSRIPSRVIRMPIGSESITLSRRATPRYVTSLSAGRRPCRPSFWRATPRTSVPPSQTSRSWRVRVDYIQPTATSSYSSATRHCRLRGLTHLTLWGELLAC